MSVVLREPSHGLTNVPPRWRRLILAALVVASVALQLKMVTEWLPFATEIDEPYFVLPAARMAAFHDPNPRWFGHPASTLLYPLAAIYAVGWGPKVAEAFASDGSAFVLAARLLSIFATAIGLFGVYTLARRAFSDLAALIAVAIVGTTFTMSSLGRSARSDGVALLFGTWALYCLLRAFEEPSRKRLVVAGIALGAAIASKYYLAAFGGAFIVIAGRERRREVVLDVVLAGACALATFAILTPYFFLDLSSALASLAAETQPHGVATAKTPLHALGWYLTIGPAGLLSWPQLVAVAVGVVLVIAKRERGSVFLLTLTVLFLASISFVRLTWERWLLPVLPVIAGLAAHAVTWFTTVLARRLARPRLGRLAAAIVGALILAGSVKYLAAAQNPTTQMLMREAMFSLPNNSHILFENEGGEWMPKGIHDEPHETVSLIRGSWTATARRVMSPLPEQGKTIEAYRCDGFDHVVINWRRARRIREGKMSSTPDTFAFYERLEKEGRLVQVIQRAGAGWPFRIYSIAGIACATNRPG